MSPLIRRLVFIATLSFTLTACANELATPAADTSTDARGGVENDAVAVFAGGCFWCMEPPFDALPGVIATTSGYTDGNVASPTYKQVSAGVTGHTEAIEVRYDPSKVSYATLLDVFWRNIDPFAVDQQFCDRGSQYRSGIYYRNEAERELAEQSAAVVAAKFDRPVATHIRKASTFYAAEDYHQDYYLKNPIRYKFYRRGCGT